MQSVKQHSYRETKEQNSNGCKLIVKKDGMLNSLDARERSYDNCANGINFTIRKVNLMFVFVVVVWIFFFNKYMIQNPVLFVYNVIMSNIVYAIVSLQAAQAHASRKSQRLIHERVTRCVTWYQDTRGTVENLNSSIENEIWSIYNDKYFEI